MDGSFKRARERARSVLEMFMKGASLPGSTGRRAAARISPISVGSCSIRRFLGDLTHPPFPNDWLFGGRALEPGESFENAAVREVYEETSIQLSLASFTGFEQAFPIKPEWRKAYGLEPTHIQEKIFYAVVPKAVEPKLSHEHKSFRWCSEPEAIALLKFANNAKCG